MAVAVVQGSLGKMVNYLGWLWLLWNMGTLGFGFGLKG